MSSGEQIEFLVLEAERRGAQLEFEPLAGGTRVHFDLAVNNGAYAWVGSDTADAVAQAVDALREGRVLGG